jgi:hypothetical protein
VKDWWFVGRDEAGFGFSRMLGEIENARLEIAIETGAGRPVDDDLPSLEQLAAAEACVEAAMAKLAEADVALGFEGQDDDGAVA